MDISSKSTQHSVKSNNETKIQQSLLLEKDKLWFENVNKSNLTFSPLLSGFFLTDRMYESLKDQLSVFLLLNKLPKTTKTSNITILFQQFQNEPIQWIEYFKHYLRLTPSYLFGNQTQDENYFVNECRNYWFFLFSPLQTQYDVLLNDMITYNYSPFEIDVNILKSK